MFLQTLNLKSDFCNAEDSPSLVAKVEADAAAEVEADAAADEADAVDVEADAADVEADAATDEADAAAEVEADAADVEATGIGPDTVPIRFPEPIAIAEGQLSNPPQSLQPRGRAKGKGKGDREYRDGYLGETDPQHADPV